MKNLLLGSVVLTLLAISITLFQISCQKDVQAQTTTYTLPAATVSSLGGVIVGKGLTITSNGTLAVSTSTGAIQQLNKILYERSFDGSPSKIEFWTANYDGTNQTKVPITLPIGLTLEGAGGNATLSPDGQNIIFPVLNLNEHKNYIYKCKLDGSELTKIIDNNTPDWYFAVLGAY